MENKVRYAYKVDYIGEEAYPRYTTKTIDTTFIQKYYNVLANLAGLNPCSRDLMEYLTEVMDNNNVVYNNQIVRNSFNDYLQTIATVTYSDVNIRKSFHTLTERKCLIKLAKGVYRVNPELYFKKSLKDRLKLIKLTLEFTQGINNINVEAEE